MLCRPSSTKQLQACAVRRSDEQVTGSIQNVLTGTAQFMSAKFQETAAATTMRLCTRFGLNGLNIEGDNCGCATSFVEQGVRVRGDTSQLAHISPAAVVWAVGTPGVLGRPERTSAA